MSASQDHDALWADRLLDLIEGDLGAAEAAQFEAHRAGCVLCQKQWQALRQLDASLQNALPPIALDASFDRRLLARISATDREQRNAVRLRAEQEFQANLQLLSRNCKQALGFVIPGAAAGIALALAIASWVDGSGVAQTVAVESTQSVMRIPAVQALIGGDFASLMRTTLTAMFGAGVGLLVARWLSATVD